MDKVNEKIKDLGLSPADTVAVKELITELESEELSFEGTYEENETWGLTIDNPYIGIRATAGETSFIPGKRYKVTIKEI